MKKFLIILVSIFLLTGCSSKENKKEITFWTLQMGSFSSYINEIIFKVSKKNSINYTFYKKDQSKESR